ncbi:MAG: hypothetical protein M1826_005159 [Phylliscum demangeonii]|nr:MAG: hypothetical protein M1826_005159 [Phylliscum demangeonii]
MHPLSSVIGLAAFLALVSQGLATPIAGPTPAPRKPTDHAFRNCSKEQKAALVAALGDVVKLGAHAVNTLTHPDYKKNNGYTHYFQDADHDRALQAFRALTSDGVKYDFQCLPANHCPSGPRVLFASPPRARHPSHAPAPGLRPLARRRRPSAFADPTPETFSGGRHVKGVVRPIRVCAQFFTSPATKRTLPTTAPESKAYCAHKETKKLPDFETGGHTLLREISHLDSYGRVAGLPETKRGAKKEGAKKEGAKPAAVLASFASHGSVDWRRRTDAGNARSLKTTSAAKASLPHTYQNAESLAAAATEMFVMQKCGVKNVNV